MNYLPSELIEKIYSLSSHNDLYALSRTCQILAKETRIPLALLEELFTFSKDAFIALQIRYTEVCSYYKHQGIASKNNTYGGQISINRKGISLDEINLQDKTIQKIAYQFYLTVRLGIAKERPAQPLHTFAERLVPNLFNALFEFKAPIENYRVRFIDNSLSNSEKSTIEHVAKILSTKNKSPSSSFLNW